MATAHKPVPASSLLAALEEAGATHVTTVPDWVQIPAHHLLLSGSSALTAVTCCTEDEAVVVAAGLYAGGKQPVVMMQNQGFYASINAIRDVAAETSVPLLMTIGQFGREFDNVDPSTSARFAVRKLEPTLDVLEIPHWRVDTADELASVRIAYDHSRRTGGAAAITLGRNLGWS